MLIPVVSLALGLALASATAPAHPRAASSAIAPDRGGLEPLVELSLERVRLADKVAAAKWGTTLPIDDPAREKQVLDAVATQSETLGLNPAVATRIFRDQIEANKLVQRALHARWRAHPGGQPAERPDLATQVRPHLDRITGELLQAIKDTGHVRERISCQTKLTRILTGVADEEDLGRLHARGLTRALTSICRRR
ncbi:chorismate mutase [Nonomuraea longicatena]|uniref:chorismate mutase n=1 Tax=Nonomuraea longicatena TaxID=83682 RepID=A0ABN1QDB4_9ACTN